MNQPATPTGKLRRESLIAWSSVEHRSEHHHSNLARMGQASDTCQPLHTAVTDGHFAASTGSAHRNSDGILAAICGRPRWKDEKIAQIAAAEGDALALIEAYRRHNTHLLEHISGAFSLYVDDTQSGTVLAATDRVGRHPIYYTQVPSGVAVANSAKAVLACEGVDRSIDPQGIYNYVYFHMVPAPGTIFKNVYKLPAAHLLVAKQQSISVHRYWTPAFSERSDASTDELAEQLRHTMQRAVRQADDHTLNTASFLSGGLDSSTVSGYLSENPKAKAFSIGFNAEGYDEMPYARLSAKHFGIALEEYYVTPDDVTQALPMIAGSYDEPFGNSSALPAYFCAKRAAEQGINRLLAGDGGDELFAGNERYVKQRAFHPYQRIPQGLKRVLIEPIVNALPQQFPLASKAQSYIRQANTSLPDRLQSYNFLHRIDPREVFERDFIAQINTALPLDLLRSTYRAPADASELNRMMFTDWQFTLADNDLRKVSETCALAGVEVAYPMLDDELIELSSRIPSSTKLMNGDLRGFYKYAFKDWLHQDTINKSKKGFGLPFGVWMSENPKLRALAYEAVSSLKSRNEFNPHFIDKAIALHQSGHSSYYGELIWILTIYATWATQR